MGYVAACCAVVIGFASTLLARVAIQATVIDREGARHEVSDLRYYNHDTFTFYRSKERVKLKFKEIASIDFRGTGERENRPIEVILRDGEAIYGTVFVGSASTGQYLYGVNQIVFTGKTDLGPFTIQLRDIKKVIFRHTDVYEKPEETQEARSADSLWATVVDQNGARFEVSELRPPHRGAFEVLQGEETRRLTFEEIRDIKFVTDDSVQKEQLSVLVTLRDGSILAGVTRVGSLRGIANIYERSDVILSGKTALGPFAISLRNVRHMVFHTQNTITEKEGREEQGKTESTVDADTSAAEGP
jgi:hypothetical protein